MATHEKLDNRILELLGERRQSPSHDLWHTDRVLRFAVILQKRYGGDMEVLTAAVRLHDLGRDNPTYRGPESTRKSADLARIMLAQTDLAPDKIDRALLAIAEHDKPHVRPSAIEGRILKDADFLAGFGVWGILRVCMWAGETGDGVPHILDRLKHRMAARIEGLEFPESIKFARRQMHIVRHFLNALDEAPLLEDARTGSYIVFEGISGSGKDTQIELLESWLAEGGYDFLRIREPPDMYHEIRKSYDGMVSGDSVTSEELSLLLAATRYRLVTKQIRPALAGGSIVLGNRSYLSTLVYQSSDVFDPSLMALIHQFVPTPDLVLLFDLDPVEAHRRLSASRGVENLSEHETLDRLTLHRPLYLELARGVFAESQLFVVDAFADSRSIHKKVLEQVQQVVSRKADEAGSD